MPWDSQSGGSRLILALWLDERFGAAPGLGQRPEDWQRLGLDFSNGWIPVLPNTPLNDCFVTGFSAQRRRKCRFCISYSGLRNVLAKSNPASPLDKKPLRVERTHH